MPNIEVNQSQAAELIRAIAIRGRMPLLLHGDPALAKSAVCRQVAESEGYRFHDTLRGSQIDPVDLRGVPFVERVEGGRGRTRWGVPEMLPGDDDGPTFLLLDEITRAPVMVQNAFLQLVNDRMCGEYRLPDSCVVMAAGNDVDTGVTKLTGALGSRFMSHIYMRADLDDWCRWAASPRVGGTGESNVRPEIIAFVRWRPKLLHVYDRGAAAWPNYRTWGGASGILGVGIPAELELAAYSGCVGEAAAVELVAFLRTFRSLPNIDGILLDPSGAPVPQGDVSVMYAISAALGARADAGNFGRIMTYLDRLPVEYSVFAVRDATVRDPSLCATPAFTTWAVNHSGIL